MSFHPFVFCPGCGWQLRAGSLTEIQKRVWRLVCHKCGLQALLGADPERLFSDSPPMRPPPGR